MAISIAINTGTQFMLIQDMHTIDDILKATQEALEGADLFYGHGTDNAWDEAVQLVLTLMDLPLTSGSEVLEMQPSDAQKRKIQDVVTARITARTPLPYLLEQAWFMHQPFYVDERVLIPRSLMGPWLLNQLAPWVGPQAVSSICEVGTGSGCIAIAAACQFEGAQVDALDISQDALDVAMINVTHYGLNDRIRLIKSDCFSALKDEKYDVILSNPPYVSHEDMQHLPEEYEHEPKLALEAPDEGLAIVLTLLEQSPAYLNKGGMIFIETGYSDSTLQARFPDAPWVWLDTDADSSGLLMATKEQLIEWRHQYHE
jgi:ribosomal protein L3 glutamine methyltransferase